MDEKLLRSELPIQSIRERNDAVTTTVPVHLAIMGLPDSVRTDLSLLVDAREVVRAWYNEDMAKYLNLLRQDGTDLPWLKGYEQFNDDWRLLVTPDNGFLALTWREGDEFHPISLNPAPVILYNQHDESGEFYTAESCKNNGWIEILYRSIRDPETVFIPPAKMRKYGLESEIARIRQDTGIAEVVARAFTSDYHTNMARTFLLRDYAVFYLNQLLEQTKK